MRTVDTRLESTSTWSLLLRDVKLLLRLEKMVARYIFTGGRIRRAYRTRQRRGEIYWLDEEAE